MNSERDKQIAKFENEFNELIKKYLNISFGISTSASGMLNDWIQIRLKIQKQNLLLQSTDYYYQPDRFYHFTNLRVLYSILQEKGMRMYNLNKSNDSEEYKCASSIFQTINNPTIVNIPYESQLKTMREYTFILSGTLEDNIMESKFWNSDYIDKQTGVALEFEIVNDPKDWFYFYSSKIKYGQLEKFEKIVEEIINLEAKYNHHTLQLDISPIISFHKNADWSDENEFRIMTNFPTEYREKIYQDYHYDSKEKGKITKYIKLPIFSKHNEKSDNTKPLLKLTNLYFDKNFKVDSLTFPKFIEELNFYIHERLGYSFRERDLINNRIHNTTP